MSYATRQEMIDRFGEDELIQLTDRANPPAGVIDNNVLDAALADADAEIDGYLQARYSLPLASVPLSIKRLARDIARYYLYDDGVPAVVAERYKEATRTLERISSGVVQLGLDASGDTTQPSTTPETVSGTPVFTEQSLADYQ